MNGLVKGALGEDCMIGLEMDANNQLKTDKKLESVLENRVITID